MLRNFSRIAPRLAVPVSRGLIATTRKSFLSGAANDAGKQYVTVHFKNKMGEKITVKGEVGKNILDVAHANGVDLEGACEGSLACSTCHVILTDSYYSKLAEPTDEENDMLDLAFGLTDTSRLGCQVVLTPELDGIECTLPEATRNMYVDKMKK